jgi:hypothetical protein
MRTDPVMLLRVVSTTGRVAASLSLAAGIGGFVQRAAAAGPSTAPIDLPADLPVVNQSNIRAAVLRLSDRNPDVRGAAREQLMGLSADDLPALRAAVQEIRPLPPGDADALHDIVVQVYLSGENADSDSGRGFMGIMMRDYESVYADGDASDSDEPLGVIVHLRLPGFAAYRALRDGDVILSISADGMEEQRIHSSEKVTEIISQFPAGTHVHLQVLRNGRHIQTTVVLDPRPRELDPSGLSFDQYRGEQEKKAQEFWTARFAPLVDNEVS